MKVRPASTHSKSHNSALTMPRQEEDNQQTEYFNWLITDTNPQSNHVRHFTKQEKRDNWYSLLTIISELRFLLIFQCENNVVYIHQICYHCRVKGNGNVDEKDNVFLIIVIKKSYLANAAMFPRV